MDIIRFAINKPVTVLVGIILIILFGILGLLEMPYQLSPTVIEPEITVSTTWPGATPFEIEREIIEEQEKVLKGIPGLREMESSSLNNTGKITLKFKIGTDVDAALLRVSNKLDEVPSYPDRVEKPVMDASGASTSPVIWMMLKTKEENPRSINEYRTFFENEIRQYLERVPGVSDLMVFGGTEREMHVVVDPERMSSYGITVDELASVLSRDNVNVSAGTMGLGRRNYRIRTVGEFKSPEDIRQTIVRAEGDKIITVGNLARVEFGYAKPEEAMMHNGKNGIVVGVKPEPGVNILELTDAAEEVVFWLNEEKLAPRNIFLDWAYDQRPYINGAIDLVKKNIFIGGCLAILSLLLYLGSFSSTAIVAVSIPTSIIGTFLFMNALGRNLNVISLAGISFAVGMLVDNAIVVLENIDRHRSMQKSPFRAAYEGTREVWGAVVASTLTTVAVFLPVVFIQEEAGQLFKDIAIAVTSAILISLFVSVLVIPMLSRLLFSISGKKKQRKGIIVSVGSFFSSLIMAIFRRMTANWATRLGTVLVFTAAAILLITLLFPKMEYLPTGNRNLVLNIMIPPPGLSYEERRDIGEQIFAITAPHFGQDRDGIPGIKQIFYIGADSLMLFGTISTHEQRAREMVPYLMGVVNSFPGIFGVSIQAGIFEDKLGGGRSVDLDVSGNDLNRIIQTAGMLFGSISEHIPGAQIRPVPSLEMLYPEVRFQPRPEILKANKMTTAELGQILDVFMDGRDIGDFKQEGEKKIDLVLMGPKNSLSSPEDLYNSLLVTRQGNIVPVSSLSRMEQSYGLTEIRHLERARTVTLQITPPEEVPIQESMEILEQDVIAPLQNQGILKGLDIRLSGAADKLVQTWDVLKWNFLLAVVITYLLLSALFGNFLYPLVILFTVPLAAAGGFLGLRLVNLLIAPQPLDVLTLLGFVILIGVVVNNAILIVHQSLNNLRTRGVPPLEAVTDATRTRLRPIYMSATTSIFGMLPLVVAPGPGSELYRGLGSVVLGGLAVSTVFTIFVIPCLLLFILPLERRKLEKEES